MSLNAHISSIKTGCTKSIYAKYEILFFINKKCNHGFFSLIHAQVDKKNKHTEYISKCLFLYKYE